MTPQPTKHLNERVAWLLKSGCLGVVGLLIACNSSILGPQITAPGLPDTPSLSTSSVSLPSTGSSSSGSGGASTGAGSSGVSIALTCSASPARTTFYTGSTARQTFACSTSASQATPTSLPSYFTLSVAAMAITVTGTPSAAGSSSWSFIPANTSQTGSQVSVTTTVLDSSTLASTLTPPLNFDATNGGGSSNDVEFNLGHKITLDSTWDGAMTDVALTAQSIVTDMHGISLSASCTGLTSPSLCNGTPSNSSLTQDGDLKFKWPWGAFDQGDYYLTVTPKVVIEGGSTTMATSTFSFTLPIQSNGNKTLDFYGSVSNEDPGDTLALEDDSAYIQDLAVSSSSTAMQPILGFVYPTYNAITLDYLTRFAIDRTKSPANSSLALSQINANSHVNLTGNAQAQGFAIKALPAGKWLAVGLKTGNGADEVHFRVISDSSSTPTSAADVGLTAFSSTANSARSVDITDPFTESTETRVGIAYVRKNGTTYYLTVAKGNVNKTVKSDILDDPRYAVDVAAIPAPFEPNSGSSMIDRVRIRQASVNGTSHFFVAYREATNLQILRAQTAYTTSYGLTGSVTFASGVFTNASTSSSLQNLYLAMGQQSGATIAAVAYRDKNGACLFKKISADLATISAALTLSSNPGPCYDPHLHFNTKTGRFIIVYAEKNNTNKYDIKMREVTPGSPDTAAAALTVVANLTEVPIRMASALYGGGDWMAIVYRPEFKNQMIFHGFHVPGR